MFCDIPVEPPDSTDSISVCDQPPRSTQSGHPFVGRCNERLGSKGRYGSCASGR